MRRGWALGLLAWLVSAPSASASVFCHYEDFHKSLEIHVDGSDEAVQLELAGQTILVDDIGGPTQPIICGGGGPPTTANTDRITIIDFTDDPTVPGVGDGRASVRIVRLTDFAPGATSEPGGSAYAEIEFQLEAFKAADDVRLIGTEAEDFWRLGTLGLDWNADPALADPAPDADLIFTAGNPPPGLRLEFGAGADTLSAQGGAGTGLPFDGGDLSLIGGAGDDTLEGSGAADWLVGEAGDDALRGFAGDDSLEGGTGDDTLDGGAGGADEITHFDVAGPVAVDLNRSEPQDTGAGHDTLAAVERVKGTDLADTLTGDGAANELTGGVGDDTLDGRGGPDTLAGGDGIDAISYTQAPAGVSVNLTTGTATAGAGDDTIGEVENLIGSPFADTLTGTAVANSIVGLGGTDSISALAGADSVDVRDGEADTASCGSEIDTAIADQQTLDSVDPDCETASFLPANPGGGGGVDGDLRFELTAEPKQRALRQRGVVVEASCPLEDCTVTASAKLKRSTRTARAALKPVKVELAAGTSRSIELALTRKARRALKAALRGRRPPKLAVTAMATDAAGNQATKQVAVKAKR